MARLRRDVQVFQQVSYSNTGDALLYSFTAQGHRRRLSGARIEPRGNASRPRRAHSPARQHVLMDQLTLIVSQTRHAHVCWRFAVACRL